MSASPPTDPLPEARLAEFAAVTPAAAIPDPVLHEARRSLVNVFATAFAGCAEQTIEALLQVFTPLSSGGTCTLIGRPETTDPATAALINAASANILDYDDTHEATIIHPAAPVFAACLAQAQTAPASGTHFLHAFTIGCEVSLRLGLAISPGHYARGWHISSTCGVFGAAAGTGVLLGLTPAQMLHAFSAAAARSAGLVETLGTGAKSVSMGGAARDGLIAARLAAAGLTGPQAPLTGQRGWLRVVADRADKMQLTDSLGTRWELARNTFKPYPTGVVLNPVIDACLQLRARHGLALDDVARIQITGHPLLPQRTDRPGVASAREAQVSAQHAVAITLLRGAAGLAEFDQPSVALTLAAGRPHIDFQDDPDGDIAAIRMVVHRHQGAPLTFRIEHATGSSGNPLSDSALDEKFLALARGTDWHRTAPALLQVIRQIDRQPDAGAAVRACAPVTASPFGA